jgi:magnesium chelatase subunit D
MLAPVDREPDPSDRGWQFAVQVAVLFAIDPAGLGGVRVRAQAGPVRDAWLALLQTLMQGRAWKRMPATIGDDRLLGGLDLPATLAAGRAVLQPGLLAEADGGVLVLTMAERLPPSTAARVAQAMDAGEVAIARDGLDVRRRARFGVVALDEATGDDDELAAALHDRLAFDLDLRAISPRVCIDEQLQQLAQASGGDLGAARDTVAAVALPVPLMEALCGTALALGVFSMRASLLAMAAARASAALDGNATAGDDDARLAAALVLAPRATRLPPATEPEDDAENPAEPPPPEAAAPEAEPPQPPSDPPLPDEPRAADDAELEDSVLEAAKAAIPLGLLSQLATGVGPRRAQRAQAGKAGAALRGGQRGRPIGSRRGQPAQGRRLHLIDTLRAAAPWQKLRRALQPDHAARVLVRPDDFQVARLRQKTATTTLFVVDASGSSALHRLAEAKGAVELLLADCYVRRDQVALIAFRGQQAELLLPPTRSLVRVKRSLSGLPGGGGTPLATALDLAGTLADSLQRRGQSPVVVVLTDGRANVARDGSGGRVRAQADALEQARQLAQLQAPVLLIDTSPKPQREAAELAQAMHARYLPLPHAGAAAVSQAVQLASRAGMR